MNEFQKEVAVRIASYGTDKPLQQAAHDFILASALPKYSYNFE